MTVREIREPKDFSKRAKEIYYKKYRKKLEKNNKGKIVAIEVESGDCFLEDTVLKAAMLGQKKYPDKIFFFIRVGYPAVHSIKGVVRK